MGIIFSSGGIVWQAFKGPVEVFAGIVWGIIIGIICWTVPNRFEKGYAKFRFYLLFCLGLLSVFGSQKLNFGGAGAMGCLTTAFVAGIGWRNQGWPDNKHPISALQGSTLLWGVITLVIGLIFRCGACFLVVQGSTLNLKEKIFAAISWLPKATIQAAFGSVALDIAREANKDESVETVEEMLGSKVLTLAVMAIVIAAPIGAIAIMTSAPKLLKYTPSEEEQNNAAFEDTENKDTEGNPT
ncbi:Mitochondrial sodium/hydrogen exchanger 9B2 [Armadillidium vulgare]|nr:Mitochondrial sodium/hydrogen exchanger 9B2 [Armadillidium vulgare]